MDSGSLDQGSPLQDGSHSWTCCDFLRCFGHLSFPLLAGARLGWLVGFVVVDKPILKRVFAERSHPTGLGSFAGCATVSTCLGLS